MELAVVRAEMLESHMLDDMADRTQDCSDPNAFSLRKAECQDEVDLELMGKGRFHFDMDVLHSESKAEGTVRIHGHLVERSDADVKQRPVCITMTTGDAATLARKIAGKLGIVVLRVVENEE